MTKSLLLTGDIHGKIDAYSKILKNAEPHNYSIQIGDFGFKQEHDSFIESRSEKDFVLFGNHDFYPYIDKEHSLGNYGTFKDTGIFYTRGAWSIDQMLRRDGHNWFSDEELTFKEATAAVEAYALAKPDTMISHDCPDSIFEHFCKNRQVKTMTGKMLQAMWEIHQPIEWYFGHYHVSKTIELDQNYNTTIFKCLNELESTIIHY